MERMFRFARRNRRRESRRTKKRLHKTTAPTQSKPVTATSEPQVRHLARRLSPLLPNWWGLVGGQIASWIALGPSFLPRRWWTTAGSVSLSQMYGYAIGSGARAVRNALRRNRHSTPSLRSATAERITQTAMLSALAAGTGVALVNASERQREIARLVQQKPQSNLEQIAGFVIGTTNTALTVGFVRFMQVSSARAHNLIRRIAPALAAPLSGFLVVSTLVYGISRYLIRSQVFSRVQAAAELKNLLPLPGRTPPTEPERSGSRASLESYGGLGRHGRAIASDGPRRADIAAFWSEPAMEPVRAYIGLAARLSIPAAAKRAVKELDRAGGFERDHLVIFVGTGTGWLNDWSMAAIEYLTRGNCAMVSMQYTVLTSALALIADRRSPQLTAQSLYREVRAHLDTLPPERRPKLYMSGESLGAFGGLSTFENATDMVNSLAGAVWAGTPQFSPIWQELTEARNPGSPYIRPDIGNGALIRFSNRPGDVTHNASGEPYAPWSKSRTIFLQHPSDPVVWWHPSLILKQPVWFEEPRGHDVTDRMRWWPWVSFWQISADMPLSLATPGGHAHRYFEEYVTAWSQVLGVDAPVAQLERAIRPFIKPH